MVGCTAAMREVIGRRDATQHVSQVKPERAHAAQGLV